MVFLNWKALPWFWYGFNHFWFALAMMVLVPGALALVFGLTVSFDGFKALNALSLQIEAGELRCIIGPNGAGKTTMMDVVTGKTRPTRARPSSATSTCWSCPNPRSPRRELDANSRSRQCSSG
jgi:ABC transporter